MAGRVDGKPCEGSVHNGSLKIKLLIANVRQRTEPSFLSLSGVSWLKAIGLHGPPPSYLNLTISIASFWQAWHSKDCRLMRNWYWTS